MLITLHFVLQQHLFYMCRQHIRVTHLLTDGVDVGAADSVGPRDVILQINVFAQVHLARDGRKDESLLTAVGHRKLDLAVKSARPQQRRVQRVGTICRHYHLHSVPARTHTMIRHR